MPPFLAVWHRERVILREPAEALDPRVRRYWLVQNLIAVVFVAVLVAVGAAVAAGLDATTVAWLISLVGGPVVVVLAPLAVVAAGLD